VTEAIVVDASAAVEIVSSTERGRRLAQLVPDEAVLWVPSHFFSEVFAAIRHMHIVTKRINQSRAESALERLSRWHLRQVAVTGLIHSAWRFRHNISGADALYVALAEQLGASLLTDDFRLVSAPGFPQRVQVLKLPIRRGT
jgi:predicted nucleic acid-binding protein